MKVTLFTKEYPPQVYGGAGVHVDYLSRYLARLIQVEVRTMGDQSLMTPDLEVEGFQGWAELSQSQLPFTKVLETFSTNLAFNSKRPRGQIVHCHTWYTFFAGVLAKQLFNLPLVVTMHSLEPLRPWKKEQLQEGYELSSWVERYGVEQADRVIAVSEEMKQDIIACYPQAAEKIVVIHNGIDLEEYHPVDDRSFLEEEGIISPYLLFVGRISRQKGIMQLLEAFESLSQEKLQLVLCAAAPDTPKLEQEVQEMVAANPRIKWLRRMVRKQDLLQLYSHAAAFICPSIYEPFGIINLEAMACMTPVIATRTGGISEVVLDGVTGLLVPPGEPSELVAAIEGLLGDAGKIQGFKLAGRKRVETYFGWETIARKTQRLYEDLVSK